MKILPLPSPEAIDSIIETYKIVGVDKNNLLALKEHLSEHIGEKNGYIIEVDKEAFKTMQSNFAELKKLRDENQILKNSSLWTVFKEKLRRSK
jgi:16S rRNA G966 N2-methylase RsmD